MEPFELYRAVPPDDQYFGTYSHWTCFYDYVVDHVDDWAKAGKRLVIYWVEVDPSAVHELDVIRYDETRGDGWARFPLSDDQVAEARAAGCLWAHSDDSPADPYTCDQYIYVAEEPLTPTLDVPAEASV